MINDPLIRVSLLHIPIFEIHYGVPILECFPPDLISKDNLFLTVLINPLYFTILPDHLIRHARVLFVLIMVLIWELEGVLILILLKILHSLNSSSLC